MKAADESIKKETPAQDFTTIECAFILTGKVVYKHVYNAARDKEGRQNDTESS